MLRNTFLTLTLSLQGSLPSCLGLWLCCPWSLWVDTAVSLPALVQHAVALVPRLFLGPSEGNCPAAWGAEAPAHGRGSMTQSRGPGVVAAHLHIHLRPRAGRCAQTPVFAEWAGRFPAPWVPSSPGGCWAPGGLGALRAGAPPPGRPGPQVVQEATARGSGPLAVQTWSVHRHFGPAGTPGRGQAAGLGRGKDLEQGPQGTAPATHTHRCSRKVGATALPRFSTERQLW